MPKRKTGFDVDRLGSWYVPSKSQKRNAIDQVTKIMAPRSGVTGSEARDQVMSKTLSKAPKLGNRIFTRKRPYKPQKKRGGGVWDMIKKEATNDNKQLYPGDEGYNYHEGDNPFKAQFWKDFIGGAKEGYNGVIALGQQIGIPGSDLAPLLGEGLAKVHRLMPKESKVNNSVGTGVHHSVPDIKLNPELRNAVAMVTGNTPLDKHAANSLPNLKQHHINHIKNYVTRRKLPGLRPRNKITKGGRTFTTLKNILVTPNAAP
jgi:hypothetical protein